MSKFISPEGDEMISVEGCDEMQHGIYIVSQVVWFMMWIMRRVSAETRVEVSHHAQAQFHGKANAVR